MFSKFKVHGAEASRTSGLQGLSRHRRGDSPLLDSGIIPGDSCQASLRLSDINKVQAGNLCFHIFLHKQRADLSVVSRVKFYPRATNHKMSAGGTAEEGKEENKVISCLFNRTQELQGTILRHLSVEPHSRFAAVVVAELRTFSK